MTIENLAAGSTILITGWAAFVLVPASFHAPTVISLRYAALTSVTGFIIALLAGGLYLYSEFTGLRLPLDVTQQLRLIVLAAAAVPAAYFLGLFYGGRFQ